MRGSARVCYASIKTMRLRNDESKDILQVSPYSELLSLSLSLPSIISPSILSSVLSKTLVAPGVVPWTLHTPTRTIHAPPLPHTHELICSTAPRRTSYAVTTHHSSSRFKCFSNGLTITKSVSMYSLQTNDVTNVMTPPIYISS